MPKPKKVIKIDTVMYDGNMPGGFEAGISLTQIKQMCGEILDENCTHEILGCPIFKGSDGKYYKIDVEAVISRISEKEAQELSADFTEIG